MFYSIWGTFIVRRNSFFGAKFPYLGCIGSTGSVSTMWGRYWNSVSWKDAKSVPTKGIGKKYWMSWFSGFFRVFSGYFQGVFRCFPGVSGFFRVFFPMPFPGMPFGPFQVSASLLAINLGNRFLSSAGVGKSCVLPIRVPNPSPTLDKNLASMGPGTLSSIGVEAWRKAAETIPDSNTTL